jgi:hypothetical protein
MYTQRKNGGAEIGSYLGSNYNYLLKQNISVGLPMEAS